ncbi:unnamed protein product, partial [Hapterophycus canaliculatus]
KVRSECLRVLELSLFHIVPKAVHLEDFVSLQNQATQTTSLDLKEHWVVNIVNFIRHHLKDVKKGWFNLDETSNEVYGFSKLRRFLAYVNFITQDTLRFLVQASLDEFVRYEE